MSLLNVSDLRKRYPDSQGNPQWVVSVPRFELEAGEQAALRGRSGCGKTTFMHLIAGILAADSGRIQFEETTISDLSEPARDRFRARRVGYVFQSFHLMRGYSCLENVELGMSFGAGVDRDFALGLLERVGMSSFSRQRVEHLSVGQQQRVAVARALANRPRLVLADEPTGSLDPENAAAALALLRELCRDSGAALLLTSHDPSVIASFERRVDFEQLNEAASCSLKEAASP